MFLFNVIKIKNNFILNFKSFKIIPLFGFFMYQQYLILFAEITRNKKSQIFVDEELFSIESPKEGVWIMSTTVASFETKLPQKVAECLFSCSLISMQTTGPQLHKEKNKILFKHVCKTPKGFVEFKNLLKSLAYQAKEWRETLRELSRQSPSKKPLDMLFFAY